MFATDRSKLAQVDLDCQTLAGALASLSTLATTWLRRNGSPPSQGHWEAVERANLDNGEVSHG